MEAAIPEGIYRAHGQQNLRETVEFARRCRTRPRPPRRQTGRPDRANSFRTGASRIATRESAREALAGLEIRARSGSRRQPRFRRLPRADLGATHRHPAISRPLHDHRENWPCPHLDVVLGSHCVRQRRRPSRRRFAPRRRRPRHGFRRHRSRQGNRQRHRSRPRAIRGSCGSFTPAGARRRRQASQGHGSRRQSGHQHQAFAFGARRSGKVVALFSGRSRRNRISGGELLRSASVLILTDEAEFARLLTACWQAERQAPGITVLGSDLWKDHESVPHDLIVVGPLRDGKLSHILHALEPAMAVILCAPADSRELGQLRSRYPRLVHVPLREDWTQTLLLVAGESLRRTEALRLARQAQSKAARNEQYATLGRYITDMKHSVNNALTSMIGNAELLLLEPGQLSKQSLAQIKTIHSMALRINEIMQRFSSLATEMKAAENASQAETEAAPAAPSRRR